jgi:hypothetical protein
VTPSSHGSCSGSLAFEQISEWHSGACRCRVTTLALAQLTGTVLTNRLRAISLAATEVQAAEYDKQLLRAAHSLVSIREVDGDRFDDSA